MGEVYLGKDTLLDRAVAIKFIRTMQPDLELRELLLLEARAATRLSPPNVPIIHRIGEIDGPPTSSRSSSAAARSTGCPSPCPGSAP